MKLKIADGLSLPLEVVTQTIAILAKRRAGKSYTMRRLVEQLLTAGQQVVIVDPKGDQWGLRSAANGKDPGLPIVILGGERGDAPLEASSGEVVAKLVVEERVSALLDLSQFRKHEVATFMTAFMENLYRLKAKEMYRTPMMLVMDEADAIAPQKPQKGEERMLGAAEDIVRRGGQRGIGCVLVTQRSAVLNKNVLTQAQILVVLRTIAPQDLAAMKAWIDVHGDEQQGRTLMESLPSLPIGDAWFWSPGWPTTEGIFQRAHVLPIETFDSGASPKPGVKPVEPKQLADVDLEALKRQMAATIEKAKQDDPRELRKSIAEKDRRIKQIEAELSKGAHIMRAETTKRVEVLTDADRALLTRFTDRLEAFAGDWQNDVDAVVQKCTTALKAVVDDRNANLREILEAVRFQKILGKLVTVNPPPTMNLRDELDKLSPRDKQRLWPGSSPVERRPEKARAGGSIPSQATTSTGLTGPQQKILDVVAMLERRGLTPNRDMVARWMPPEGIHPNGGSYGENLGFLRAEGYLEDRSFVFTAKGRAVVREMATGLSPAREVLNGGQRNIIDMLDAHRDRRFTRDSLAEALGIHPNGGSYGENLARLRTMGLIPERGDIYLTEAAHR